MQLLIFNFLFWLVLMFFAGIIVHFIPPEFYDPENFLFKPRKIEFDGKLYTSLFAIKKWKDRLPECGEFFKFNPFNKKRLQKMKDLNYFERFILETCRAELTHWIPILLYPVSLLWNPYPASIYVLIFVLLTNFPFLIIQRYNRIRFLRVVDKLRMERQPA
uniref:Glycosyl-4,4'-diaponeurosporenoate acyltransferase n=1 Tax=candidate division WOR-3 bacterium TaxID=2052148 RepID=A0A7V3ZXR6_UNCW3